MKLKHTLAALAVAAASVPALAADQAIDLSAMLASFGSTAPLLEGGDDAITFTGLAAGTYDFTVTVTAQFIGDLTAELNGQPLQMQAIGPAPVIFGYLQGTAATPLVLTLSGTDIRSPLASYSVTMSASLVPEPATWASMALGLAALGFLARRRAGR